MQTKTIITLIALTSVAVAITYLIYSVYKMQKPSPGNCDYIKASNPSAKWSDGCQYIQEISFDPSIETPTLPLYLNRFTQSPSLGQAWGANAYYKYVYVDINTGKYGKASPWTSSPISAGGVMLPCKTGGDCQVGKDTCKSNLVELGVDSVPFPPGSNMCANVHRYVTDLNDKTPPSDTTVGKIVGMLLPNGSGGGKFIDLSGSVCDEVSCRTPVGC